MPSQRDRDTSFEADGVLVQPISGQIYLVEEKNAEPVAPWEDEPALPPRSPLSGLINRH
jgi:hypothetical protein